jgi:hypothetical protein
MPGYWPMTEAADGTRPEPQLDRETARALVDAGYMPLADYVAIYGIGDATQPKMRGANQGNERRQAPPRPRLMHPKRLRRLTLRRRKTG